MKLLQLNEWGGRLEGAIADLLVRQAADVVCLQEAVDTKGRVALTMPTTQLVSKTDYKHVFSSPLFTFGLMNKSATLGNTILSKHPFAKTCSTPS
jgi:endonuclease/exonuclease/phosphatase family metal-dependent hydrolase